MSAVVRQRLRGVVAVVGALSVLGLAGCTGDDPQPSPSPSASQSASVEMRDRSAELLGYQAPTQEVGSGTADAAGYFGSNNLTVHIGSVRVGSGSTLVTMWFTTPDGHGINGLNEASWPNWPTLVDPSGQREYVVETFEHPGEGRQLGVLRDPTQAFPGLSEEITAFYPPLPAGVTSVEVHLKGFDPITVPVTR